MTFWIVAAVATAAALAALLHPLLRARSAAPDAEADLSIYRDQLAEIDRDQARGLLDADQAEAARIEVQRRMLAAAPAEDAAPAPSPALRGAGVAVVVAAPLLALGLYLGLGAPGAPDVPLSSRQAAEAPPDPRLVELVDQVRARLDENPDEVQGWVLLGRGLTELGREAEALEALNRAMELSNQDPLVGIEVGETLVMLAGGAISPRAKGLFEAGRQAVPDDPRPWLYLGNAAMQDNRPVEGLEYWKELVRRAPPDAPWLPGIRERVEIVARELGVPAGPEGLAGASAGPGPDAAAMEAAADMTAEERAEMIQGMVDRLAARLAENPDDRDGWLRLARARQVLGDVAGTRAALERALDLTPADAPERAAIEAQLADLPADG